VIYLRSISIPLSRYSTRENTGSNDYDALNLSLEKRYANRWSGRVSYSLSKSRGTAENQADKNTFQKLTDLNLDEFEGPSSVDRRHVLALNGRAEIPKTGGANLSATMRYMSGAPFSIFNSNIDVDQNGELNDPSPAGTYSGTAPDSMQGVQNDGGRNGAVGPDYFQLDLRAGWRRRIRGEQAIELFLDIFNVTNRANFDNPAGDERLPATFLVLNSLRGGGGFPRQAQSRPRDARAAPRTTRTARGSRTNPALGRAWGISGTDRKFPQPMSTCILCS